MAKEASEIPPAFPNLPPAERGAATMRVAMLSGAAHGLITGALEAPLELRAGITRPDASRKQLPL